MNAARAPTAFNTLRRSRTWLTMLVLGALLCAQAALAFYRCPQLTAGAAEMVRTPCEQMDMELPALCKAFVQGDAQGLDGKRFALDFGVAAPTLFGTLPPRLRPSARLTWIAHSRPWRARPPPLWITFGRHRD